MVLFGCCVTNVCDMLNACCILREKYDLSQNRVVLSNTKGDLQLVNNFLIHSGKSVNDVLLKVVVFALMH